MPLLPATPINQGHVCQTDVVSQRSILIQPSPWWHMNLGTGKRIQLYLFIMLPYR